MTDSQIEIDYGQVAADAKAKHDLYQEYDAEFQTFLSMVAEMKAGHLDPDKIINYFMYVMMPSILGKSQDSLSILGDQLNVLSDYRSLIAQAQSDFNKFNDGQGTDDDYTDLTDTLSQISKALGYDSGYATVLDSSTISQIQTALDALTGDGGLLDGKDAQYLNNLWDSSKQPTDPGSGNYDKGQTKWIAGASETIKNFGENFNTINTGVTTFSQGTQTQTQYTSSQYQQFLGTDNQFLQSRAKFVSALVSNEKTG